MKKLMIVVPPLLKHNETALVDSDCTENFLLSNALCLHNSVITNPLAVRLPNGQTMKSTHTAILDIPQLSKAAKSAHIFPAMENNSLLPVGQLCDEGYSILFSIDEVTIMNATQKNSDERRKRSYHRVIEDKFVSKQIQLQHGPKSVSDPFSR
jgi:hypothetical protein